MHNKSPLRFGLILLLCLMSNRITEASINNREEGTHRSVRLNKVILEYEDWGGSGETLLLLSDFRDNARNFNEFASLFTDRFHVLGLSRRGSIGFDVKSTQDYSTSTRVEDLKQFITRLRLHRVRFMGHGSAADEMTCFAIRYPECVEKLVYLQPIDDYGKYPAVWAQAPYITPWEKRMLLEVVGSPEAISIVPTLKPKPEDWNVEKALRVAAYTLRPEYARVRACALAIYAAPETNAPRRPLPGPSNSKGADAPDPWWEEHVLPLHRAAIEEFRTQMPCGRVVELRHASNEIYKDGSSEIVPQVRNFLLGEPLPLVIDAQ